MPCDTRVQLVQVENDKFTIEARKKLGLSLTGGLTQEDAKRVRIEAGKLKTAAAIKAINPTAIVTGLTVGSKKLTIQVNI